MRISSQTRDKKQQVTNDFNLFIMEINTKQILSRMRHGDRANIARMVGVSNQLVYNALKKETGFTETDLKIIGVALSYLKDKAKDEKKIERKIINEINKLK